MLNDAAPFTIDRNCRSNSSEYDVVEGLEKQLRKGDKALIGNSAYL